MLKRNYDASQPYRVAVYCRMSAETQNPRSPDQQLAEIKQLLQTLGYPWSIERVYCDRAKSGRLLRDRPEYQKMLQDIRTGSVAVDLILVDTLERFGRVDELPTIRKTLYEQHGVLVLTADSRFVDPHTPQGKALGMMEAMRATEDGRIKAHNVLRGKRDAARQKHWPGGPPPFGYLLQSVMSSFRGRKEVAHCTLVPDPETSWVISLVFNTAEQESWGTTKLARLLNEHPDIPERYKPFHSATIGRWLDNPIYYGELTWERTATGIVDDRRVVEKNQESDIVRVPAFCEPLVSQEIWTKVQALRQVHRDRVMRHRGRKTATGGKLIMAPAPGLSLHYLLSGLVCCGECGRRMVASSPTPYVTKAGESRRYTSYVCPGYLDRVCPNSTRISESWLRERVVSTLRERLFPCQA